MVDECPGVDTDVPVLMTRYEYCSIIAERAKAIAAGSEPTIDTEGEYEPLAIARMELDNRTIPLIVRRTLPNGKTYIHKVKNMSIRDH